MIISDVKTRHRGPISDDLIYGNLENHILKPAILEKAVFVSSAALPVGNLINRRATTHILSATSLIQRPAVDPIARNRAANIEVNGEGESSCSSDAGPVR